MRNAMLNVRITNEQRDDLTKIANENGHDVSTFVRTVLRAVMQRDIGYFEYLFNPKPAPATVTPKQLTELATRTYDEYVAMGFTDAELIIMGIMK